MTWLLLAGLISLIAQVVVLRELAAALYGVELIYLIALGIWMLSTAAGAALGRRLLPAFHSVLLLLALVGLALPVDVVAVRSARWLFGAVPGAFLSFPFQLATVAMAVVPVAGLLGLLFQWAAAHAIADGRTPASAYAVEGLGGLVGGVVVTALVRAGVSTMALALGTCALALSYPAVHLLGLERRRSAWRVGAFAVLFAPLVLSSSIDVRLASLNHPDLLDVRDTPYSRVVVTGRAGQITAFSNDVLVFDSESAVPEAFAGLTASQHASPQRALVLGGGSNGVARELTAYVAGAVDNVELDRRAYETVQARLPAGLARADDRVHFVFADPRVFLREVGSDAAQADGRQPGAAARSESRRWSPYDPILVAMPEPSSGEASRFYTREFFALCRRALTGGGAVGLRLPAAENVWTPALAQRTASVYRALKLEFSDVLVLPGSTLTLLASNASLTRDPGLIETRLRQRGGRPRLLTPEFVRYLLTNDRQAETTRLLESTSVPANTDARPACYQYAAIVWLSMFYPRLGAAELQYLPAGWRGAAWLAAVLGGIGLIVSLLVRRRPGLRLVVMIVLVGAAAMMLETVLILRFQIANGVVFQDVGLLLSCFMAGLAAGAFGIDRLSQRARPPDLARRRGVTILAALCGLSLVASPAAGVAQGWAVAGLGLGATGAAVGAAFGYATSRWPRDRARGLGALYAADLVGGCAGTLAATLVLVPQAGLDLTAMAAAMLAATAMLFI